MRLHSITTACVLAGALTWGIPATGLAQAKKTSGTIAGAAELGARAFTTEPTAVDKGKFEEYRALPAGALLERARLTYTPADSFGTYQLTSRRLGQLDQSLWLQASRPGLYDFNIRWDRLPHLYSSTARSPGNEGVAAPGFNTLPTPRPDSTAWKNAPYIGNVRTIWDPMKAKFALSPSEKLDFEAEYVRIGKKGGLPKSISYGGSGGPTREYVSPIDETVNNFRLSQSYTSGTRAKGGVLAKLIESYQGTVSYEYSRYTNALSSVMVDNPQLSTAAITGTPTGTNTARVSLAPSNAAQTLSLVGALLLPFRTRVTGSLNASWQTQNDAFLPQYNNAALATDPNAGLLTNLTPSLDGKVKLTTVHVAATSHPIAGLTLAAKYRNHSYSNETPIAHIRAMAISDRSIALGDSLYSEWDPFTKVNTDLSAAYAVARNASVAVGYAVEDFTREPGVYTVDATREKSPRVSADYSGLDWLNLHASYTASQRHNDGIYREAPTEVTGNRRAFVANRDRRRANLMATITPIDQISVGLSLLTGDDKYPNSRFGMQSDKSTTTGVDVDWAPTGRISLGAGYSKENVDNVFFHRYRTGAVGSITYDNPNFYFTSSNKDENTSTFASVNAVLIPDRLTMRANASVIEGTFHEFNVNTGGVPSVGTAAQNLTATVEDWPEVAQKMTPIAVAFQYRMNANWAVTFRYTSETYTNDNWQQQAPKFTSTTVIGGTPTTSWTGDLPGNVGATTGSNTGQFHFLGNNYHGYTARYLTFTVSWHPGSLPLDLGRSTF